MLSLVVAASIAAPAAAQEQAPPPTPRSRAPESAPPKPTEAPQNKPPAATSPANAKPAKKSLEKGASEKILPSPKPAPKLDAKDEAIIRELEFLLLFEILKDYEMFDDAPD